MDTSIIRELLEFNVEAANVLGIDEEFVKTLEETAAAALAALPADWLA